MSAPYLWSIVPPLFDTPPHPRPTLDVCRHPTVHADCRCTHKKMDLRNPLPVLLCVICLHLHPHHNTLLMQTPWLAMLLSIPTPLPHPTQPNPHPRGCSVPTSQPIGLWGGPEDFVAARAELFVLLWMPGTGWRVVGGYSTKLVSIQIANFHMVLADPKRKNVAVVIRLAPVNPSAWLIFK